MNQVIVWTQPNGIIAICTPTGEVPIDVVLQKDVPSDVVPFVIDRSTLPNEARDFYNAWEQTNGVITINFEKAKNVTKQRLRYEREPLLQAQDIAFQRALETGADTTAIIAEKQRLRNITNLADSCTTLDELRAIHC